MAIGFGRIEFIKRSEGRNACQLSAYLSRSRIFFEGNCALEPKLYDFSHREDVYHHEIILPEGADENLRNPEVLWNLAERKEVRKDAQVSMHLVLALPDDKEITPEERVELASTFIKKHYDGLVAEVVIHPPERTIEFTEENEALGIPKGAIGTVIEKKGENYIVSLPKGVRANPFVEIGVNYPGMSIQEHNWHAHAQLSTRRLKDNGKEFEDYKATDLMPVVMKGKVVEGLDVGKLWAQLQNEFFLSKGLALRVEDNGLIPQEHLGPVRMRGRAYALLEEHEKRLELNALAVSNPRNILEALTDRQSVFTKDDVERFMLKHVPEDKVQEVRDGFWKLEDIVQLKSKETKEWTSEFTNRDVIEEEQQILRLADRINSKRTKVISDEIQNAYVSGLSEEQKDAYHNILNGKGLSCIQGYAGTGKSYLLKALKDAYEERGFIVRSFGPDNATANVLKEKGFSTSENIYRFLFSTKHGLRTSHNGFEVWMLDEAGKLGNKPLLEFLKLAEKSGAKVILVGDAAQLSSVERGGVFKEFCQRYGSQVLQDIQRQKDMTARAMAKDLAKGNIGFHLDKLNSLGGIQWSLTRRESIKNLVTQWAVDHRKESLSTDSSLIIAGSNREVRVINEMVRIVRQGRGEIGEKEFKCETAHGTIYVSEGDRIEFCKNDKELRIENRMSGVLIKAEDSSFSVAIQENGKKTRVVTFDPKKFHGFQLGYASTCNRAQGRTLQNAYFLHSAQLNKQMAYVALTRHVNVAKYFVSKEEAFCLSDLKRQALKDFSKKTTLEYTHTIELEKMEAQEKRAQEIEELKQSDQFSARFKGGVLSLRDRFHAHMEKRQDRKLSEDFFNFKKEGTAASSVEKAEQTSSVNPNIAKDDQILSQEVVQAILKEDGQYFYTPHLSQDKVYQEPIFKDLKSGPTVDNLIHRFVEQGALASDYREQVENEADQENKSPEETERFKDQQQAVVRRNTYAFLANYRALSENISLENTYGKSMQQKIDHFCERFNASFQVEKGLKTTEGINELSVSYAKKYDRLLVSSLDLQKKIQIEAALSEKSTEECSKFELWRETCGQRNALAYVLRESLSSEKSFEDTLSEKVLKYA
ncbi:MAG: AAA family ATPase, partial [Simkania sp.]|nr:AAA family ATPase [Simkania sp.]